MRPAPPWPEQREAHSQWPRCPTSRAHGVGSAPRLCFLWKQTGELVPAREETQALRTSLYVPDVVLGCPGPREQPRGWPGLVSPGWLCPVFQECTRSRGFTHSPATLPSVWSAPWPLSLRRGPSLPSLCHVLGGSRWLLGGHLQARCCESSTRGCHLSGSLAAFCWLPPVNPPLLSWPQSAHTCVPNK